MYSVPNSWSNRVTLLVKFLQCMEIRSVSKRCHQLPVVLVYPISPQLGQDCPYPVLMMFWFWPNQWSGGTSPCHIFRFRSKCSICPFIKSNNGKIRSSACVNLLKSSLSLLDAPAEKSLITHICCLPIICFPRLLLAREFLVFQFLGRNPASLVQSPCIAEGLDLVFSFDSSPSSIISCSVGRF